jgi:hypothetical protein
MLRIICTSNFEVRFALQKFNRRLEEHGDVKAD